MAQPAASRPPQSQQNGPREKILRIGIILGGKIVEERLIRKRETVTLGQSAKNTFSIPAPELPKSWPLFQLTKEGKYLLNFQEGMDARISDGGNVNALAQLKSGGQAQKMADRYVLPLTDMARGKIMLGEMTILFQFVMAPPLQPRPQLPQSVRGRLLDRIDPYMAVVLAFSLLVHGGAIGWIYRMDEPRKPEPDEIPEIYARAVMVKPPEPPAKPVETGGEEPGETKEEPVKEEPKKGGGEKPTKEPAGGDDAGGDAEAKAKEEAEARGVIATIGAKGTSGEGRFNDVTDGKNPGGDLQAGIDKARKDGQGVATNGRAGQGGRGSATGTVGEGKGTGVAGPKGGDGGKGTKVGEEKVGVVETKKPIVDDDGGLDAESVYKKIKTSYAGQVSKCYNDALKSNSGLKGRVDVTITIGVGGNVTSVDVSGFDSGVDACISAAARRWRFDKPPNGPATFQFPFSFTSK